MFRKLLLMTVLATDLSVHGEFMRRFDRMLVERNGPSGESAAAEGPGPVGGKTGEQASLYVTGVSGYEIEGCPAFLRGRAGPS